MIPTQDQHHCVQRRWSSIHTHVTVHQNFALWISKHFSTFLSQRNEPRIAALTAIVVNAVPMTTDVGFRVNEIGVITFTTHVKYIRDASFLPTCKLFTCFIGTHRQVTTDRQLL